LGLRFGDEIGSGKINLAGLPWDFWARFTIIDNLLFFTYFDKKFCQLIGRFLGLLLSLKYILLEKCQRVFFQELSTIVAGSFRQACITLPHNRKKTFL